MVIGMSPFSGPIQQLCTEPEISGRRVIRAARRADVVGVIITDRLHLGRWRRADVDAVLAYRSLCERLGMSLTVLQFSDDERDVQECAYTIDDPNLAP
jgi:hypothetical protein